MTSTALLGFTWPDTAAETAVLVLRWAAQHPREPVPAPAAPPRGSLRSLSALASSATVTAALRGLTRATAARLGAGDPILGDRTPLSLGGVLLAAAIGGREQTGPARRLAAAIPPPALSRPGSGPWADALARHAVVGPALGSLAGFPDDTPEGDELVTALLDASPLTGLLRRPSVTGIDRAVGVALALLSRPHGPTVLVSALSRPDPDPRVLRWRAGLLRRLVTTHPGFVLEVYAAARLRHGQEWDRAVQAAALGLAAVTGAGPVDQRALTTVQYWAALRDRRLTDAVPGVLWRDDVRPVLVLLDRYRLAEVRAA